VIKKKVHVQEKEETTTGVGGDAQKENQYKRGGKIGAKRVGTGSHQQYTARSQRRSKKKKREIRGNSCSNREKGGEVTRGGGVGVGGTGYKKKKRMGAVSL